MAPERTKGQSRTAEVWKSLMVIDMCMCACIENYIPCTLSGSCLSIRLGQFQGCTKTYRSWNKTGMLKNKVRAKYTCLLLNRILASFLTFQHQLPSLPS